jgi:tetratricopeptide (TPR) repeat protein
VKDHGRLVRRDQIILDVWPDSHVGEGSLNVQVTTIRKTLGQDYIEAVPKLGYRFTAEVVERAEDLTEQTPAVTGRPRVWVLVPLLVIAALVALYLVLRFRTKPEVQSGGSAVALYHRALGYERIGDDEQALSTLDQALTLDSAYQPACVRAAYIAYELDEEQKATDYLARCKAVETQDEVLRLKAQGLDQVLNGDPERGMQVYKLLIDIYPRDIEGLYRFAELATNLDRLEEAEGAVRACLAIEPEDRDCLFQSMYVKLKRNQFADVLTDYQALPPGVREYPWFGELVGVAQFGNGHLDEAIRTFEQLSEGQQTLHGTKHFHFRTGKEQVADVWLYEGRVREATDRIKQLMETPDSASDRGGYLVYLAQIHMLLGDLGEAEKYAKRCSSRGFGDFGQGRAGICSGGESPQNGRATWERPRHLSKQ